MKTYTVLYAEDVPHYGAHEVQAENDASALEAAIALHESGAVTFDDAQWSDSVCARIVHIEDEHGNIIGEDHPIDDYFLRSGGTAAKLLCDAADEMLKALEAGQSKDWVANAGITNDIEALRRICIAHADWWNNIAWPLIAKATGR